MRFISSLAVVLAIKMRWREDDFLDYEAGIRAVMLSLFGPNNIAWLEQERETELPIGPGFFGYPASHTRFIPNGEHPLGDVR